MFKARLQFKVTIGLVAVFLLAAPVRLGYAQGRGAAGSFPDLLALLARAMEVQQRHTDRLLQIGEVVGTAVGLADDGQPAVKVFTRVAGTRGIPAVLDGIPVVAEATGEFFALPGGKKPGSRSPVSPATTTVDPTAGFPLPTPIGVSTGNHLSCSAGTIAARVKKNGALFALSNNHVLALENKAPLNSNIVQPGIFDTYPNNTCSGAPDVTPAVIGALTEFAPINFNCKCVFVFCSCDRKKDNTIDAAIALSSAAQLGNATPSDGYLTPQSATVAAVLNQAVKKYGRTTSLTKGTISGINATVIVGYSSGTARFKNQLIISSNTTAPLLLAGDSGSLVVSDLGNNPIGLAFAANASGSQGIANTIDSVLSRFGVIIDGQ